MRWRKTEEEQCPVFISTRDVMCLLLCMVLFEKQGLGNLFYQLCRAVTCHFTHFMACRSPLCFEVSYYYIVQVCKVEFVFGVDFQFKDLLCELVGFLVSIDSSVARDPQEGYFLVRFSIERLIVRATGERTICVVFHPA